MTPSRSARSLAYLVSCAVLAATIITAWTRAAQSETGESSLDALITEQRSWLVESDTDLRALADDLSDQMRMLVPPGASLWQPASIEPVPVIVSNLPWLAQATWSDSFSVPTAWLGLYEGAGRAHLYRATLEGTACLVRQMADRLALLGLGGGDWRASGGGARSSLWLAIIAALLDRPLIVVEPEEGPRGACLFLAVGLGWYATVDEAVDAWVRPARIVEPAVDLVAAYQPVFERFARLDAAVAAVEQPQVDPRR